MARILSQRYTLSVGATRMVRINCTDDLDDGASLTGTPTVAELVTEDLTLENKAVNTSSYTSEAQKKSRTVNSGKGIEFTVSGGKEGRQYIIQVSCGTDSSPAETLVYHLILEWT